MTDETFGPVTEPREKPVAYGIPYRAITPAVVKEIIFIFATVSYEQELWTNPRDTKDEPILQRGIVPEIITQQIKKKLMQEIGNPADIMHPLSPSEESLLFYFADGWFGKSQTELRKHPVRIEYYPGEYAYPFDSQREEVSRKTAEFREAVNRYLISSGKGVPLTSDS